MIPRNVFIFMFLFNACATWAWNGRGHSLSAAIAYKQLTQSQKTDIATLLKQHPQYALSWKNQYVKLTPQIEEGLFLLMAAAEWPDDIRNHSHPLKSYHKDKWHYINYKIYSGNLIDTTMPLEDNIVQALAFCHEKVKSSQTSKAEKAIYFAWIVHLLGDVHQPLHCGSFYSNSYPKGDNGGNHFWVKPKTAPVKLHALWDGALGSGGKLHNIVNQAVLLQSKYPIAQCKNLQYNPRLWSIESVNMAFNTAYQKASLSEAVEKEQAAPLPENYFAELKKTAEIRVCYSGYRLAQYITGL